MNSIYKITNTLNDKVYIGKTMQKPKTRWSRHQLSVKNGVDTFLYRAMRKYGIENFLFEVIYSDEESCLEDLECEFIRAYDCCVLDGDEKGYNMTRGGDGLTSESAKIVNRKTAATRIQNGSYKTGKDHPRARRMIAVDPSGQSFEIHGNLKAFCHERNLSWQTLRNNANRGPIVIDRKKYKNVARLSQRFWNSVGWQLSDA